MKEFIYITGDSFCAKRQTDKHWPKILADMLGLELLGNGYPGYGWWPSCQDFMSKFESSRDPGSVGWIERTKIFIFCHTDIHRPLTGNKEWVDSGGFTAMMDYHLKYISDPVADSWCAEKWYKQIGDTLCNFSKEKPTIIHLNCFDQNQHLRKFMTGKVFDTSLLDVSMRSAGADPKQFRTGDILEKINSADNHLCEDYNNRLAEFLHNNLYNDVTDIKL